MKILSGYYDLKTNEYTDLSRCIYSFSADSRELFVFGSVYTGTERNDGKKILSLYSEYGREITGYLSGSYILLIYDSAEKAVRVFYDRATSPVAFYYTISDDIIYMSTSLGDLLDRSAIERSLNDDVIEEFLLNGFIYGSETLIKNVKKAQAYRLLEISNGRLSEHKAEYPLKSFSPGEALESYAQTLDSAIIKTTGSDREVNLPLSSGYDSNYIAYVVTEKAGCKAKAFSVGGKRGKNELPVVEENIKYYRNLELKSAVTDGDSLKNLPDIVLRLEGNVYESGIFLQYELMKLVKNSGADKLICGECADQVMNLYYHTADRINPDSGGKPVYYEFSEYPYIFSSYLILKKSGILANSFGIDTEYPYLDEDFISVCAPLGFISRKDKRVHVANCCKCLPPEIVRNMSKKGGSTDCRSLFESDDENKRFFKRIEKNPLFRKYSDYIFNNDVFKKEKQTGITLLKTKVRNLILAVLRMKKDDPYFIEVKLRLYLCAAYLIIFNELFVIRGGSDEECKNLIFDDIVK